MSDIAGQRFGRLVALRRAERVRFPSGSAQWQWECQCDCGSTSKVFIQKLRTGHTTSCGCLRMERLGELAEARRTHGESMDPTPEFNCWKGIVQRCTDPNAGCYARYGGRGILICEEWMGPDGYQRFLAHVGRRPSEKHSIDRKDNARGYEPGNVRWATASEQALNRRSNRIIEFGGVRLPLKLMAERHNLTARALEHRLARGWSIERALAVPQRGASI